VTFRAATSPRRSGAGLGHEIVRGLVTGLVIAMLVVTGQLVAAAKGDAPRDMAGSLCLSGSIVTFVISEDGTPEGPAHICPDALLVALDTATPEPSFGGWQLVFDHGAPRLAASWVVITPPEAPPPARAPPVPV